MNGLLVLYSQVTHDLRSKLSELETYREIVCRQVDLLQAYFEVNSESELCFEFMEYCYNTKYPVAGCSYYNIHP